MPSFSPDPRRSRRQFGRNGRTPDAARRPDGKAPSEAARPLPELDYVIELNPDTLDKLAARIRDSHKAHPFLDTARRVLSRSRHLQFSLGPKPGAKLKFYLCIACGEPFLESQSLIEHHLHHHAEALYSLTQTALEPPKGNFTMIASCGICNETLCPPNFHRYTEILVAHHQRRHRSAHFDDFKARVRISREAPDIEAWKKSFSTREEFHCKHCHKQFASRAEFAAHAAAEHAALLFKTQERLTLTGDRASALKCAELRRVIARALRQQRKLAPDFLGKLRRALNLRKLQFFRNAAGHQFINGVQPRLPQAGDLADPMRAEIFRLAAAPARRGHKPTRKTLLEHFGAKPDGGALHSSTEAAMAGGAATAGADGVPLENAVADAIQDLVRAGLIVEYLDGELDAPAALKAQADVPALSQPPETVARGFPSGQPISKT
jgi:hypothetical protein